jgi:tryptophanase
VLLLRSNLLSLSTYNLEIMHFQTIIEPFKIKSVEPIRQTTREERQLALEEAGYNLFQVRADHVVIDLLTDSGTSAMSAAQWAGMMQGDESYACGRSFYKFQQAVQDITGWEHVVPTHQGRAAERILFTACLKPGDIVPNNTHFDTTRANVQDRQATAVDIPIAQGKDASLIYPFKGNMDTYQLETLLKENPSKIPIVMLTVTNNSGGGQPVSMENIRRAAQVCHSYDTLLFLDACRFAENAWFIKMREEGYADRSPAEIAKEMFNYVDGCTMSAKKDGLANMGGFLAFKNDSELVQSCKNVSFDGSVALCNRKTFCLTPFYIAASYSVRGLPDLWWPCWVRFGSHCGWLERSTL